MAKRSRKCDFCGAPFSRDLNGFFPSCTYCGQPVSKISEYFGDGKGIILQLKNAFKQLSIPSKEKVNNLGRNLLKKQNILSDTQIHLFERSLKRVVIKKNTVLLLFVIPITIVSFWKIYNQVNYPQTAKPYFPEFPLSMNIPEGTGDFISSTNYLVEKKIWCKQFWESESLSDCIKSKKLQRSYLDIGSKRKDGDWFVFKTAFANDGDSYPTIEGLDTAINCKKRLIATYQNDGLDKFYELQSKYPGSYGKKQKEQYLRKKPTMVARKMGKLWWISNYSYRSDLEDGEYLASDKQLIREVEASLSSLLDNKKSCGLGTRDEYCSAETRKANIALIRDHLKSEKSDLDYERFNRKRHSIEYNTVLKAACKS